MTEKEEEQFQSSNTCRICEKLIDDDDEKVRDHCHIRHHTLNMKGGGLEGFCGDHEIFLKIFDGPQNIFLFSIFVILFLS